MVQGHLSTVKILLAFFQNVTGMVVLNMILSSSTNMKLYDYFKEQLKENG